MPWAERLNEARESDIVDEISVYIDDVARGGSTAEDKDDFLNARRERLHDADNTSVLVIAGLFAMSLSVIRLVVFAPRLVHHGC